MSNIQTHLQEFGLSEKQASVYSTLLNIGPTTASEVAREAKLNRSTAYALLDSLVSKGFVESIHKNATLEYASVSPNQLVERAEKLSVQAAQLNKKMDLLLPELLELSGRLKNRPRMLFYEGVAGIKTIDNDLIPHIRSSEIYLLVPQTSLTLSMITSKSKGARVKTIALKTANASESNFASNTTINTKYIPASKYPFESELRIYGDRVVFISGIEEFGVIITSQDAADVMKNLFELAWEEAIRLDTKSNKATKLKRTGE